MLLRSEGCQSMAPSVHDPCSRKKVMPRSTRVCPPTTRRLLSLSARRSQIAAVSQALCQKTAANKTPAARIRVRRKQSVWVSISSKQGATRGRFSSEHHPVSLNAAINHDSLMEITEPPHHELNEASLDSDVIGYTKWIYYWAKQRKMETAKSVFAEMEEKGIRPNAVTFTALIRGYALSGNPSAAFECYRDMVKRDIRPNVITLATLLEAYVMDGDIARSIDVLKEFRTFGIEPNIIAFNTLMTTCKQKSDLRMAVHLFEYIDVMGMQKTMITYNTMLDIYAHLGCAVDKEAIMKKGFEIKDEIERTGFVCDVNTFNSLIKLCFRLLESERAIETFEEMKASNVQPDAYTYSLLIDGMARNYWKYENEVASEICFELLDEMRSRSLDVSIFVYNAMMKLCLKQADYEQTKAVFNAMLDDDVAPDVFSFGLLIDCYVKYADHSIPEIYLQGCFDLFNEMKDFYNLKPTRQILGSLINACAVARDLSSMKKLLWYIKRDGMLMDIVLYTSVMKVYLSVDDVRSAIGVISDMEKDGLAPNVYAFNSLLQWFLRKGDVRHALRIVRVMQSKRIRGNKLTNRLLQRLTRMGGN